MRLVVDRLACRRGERLLFTDLSFVLEPGAVLLVMGPNGAGKSSLLRIVAGFLRASEGTVRLEPDEEAGRMERLHYLGHLDAAKPQLGVLETLRFWQAMLGGTADPVEILGLVGLDHAADLPAGYLSAGQRRRLSLARLLASPRPLWLLDEPTASLDAAGEALLASLIARHREGGGMVMAATHTPLAAADARVLRFGPA